MPLNIVFFGASKLVSTKTLLLKHYCRRQGFSALTNRRHIRINFLTNPGPGTNPGLLLIYTVEAQFAPGTAPVCPWDKRRSQGGRQSLCVQNYSNSVLPLCVFISALRPSRVKSA